VSSSSPRFSQHVQAISQAAWGADAATSGWKSAHRYVAAPSATTANQLLPWSVAAIVAAGGRRSLDRPWSRRLRDAAGTAALFGRATIRRDEQLGIIPGRGPMIDVLRDELKLPIHRLVILCGPPRANQKPVLQAIDRFGRTVAFAKLAWNDLTTTLLAHEHAVLADLATRPLGPVEIPQVIGAGCGNGVDWLALSPVRTHYARRALTHFAAADAIARAARTETSSLGQADFAEALTRRSSGLPLAAAAVERLLTDHGTQPLVIGSWHGDFVPWNMSAGKSTVAVWDWERFATGVPIGFDRLHFAMQVAVHRTGMTVAQAIATTRVALPRLLSTVEPAGRAATFDAYLAEMLIRYEHDALESPNPNLTAWCEQLAQTAPRPEVAR
jgi:hypothetical protein